VTGTPASGPASASPNSHENWALFLDFDGTLVDIAERPEAVVVDPGLPALLHRLRERCGGALAIVTGRAVSVIEAFLPGLDLDICGLHGMERRINGRLQRVEPVDLPLLRAAVPTLAARLSPIPGVLIEDKGESVALHWRLAPEAAPQVREAADSALRDLGPNFRLQDGKAVVEIVPEASGKGRAVEALLMAPPYRERRPLFAGDDVTDENGFRAIEPRAGISIKIGPGQTAAAWRIGSPAAFRLWLSAFEEDGSAIGKLPAADARRHP
jgi:trehalose 6-phosphate phosphatase